MGCGSSKQCDSGLDLDGIHFNADPDIGGLGVIFAFLIPAFVALFMVLVGYFLGAIPAVSLNRLDQMYIFPRGLNRRKKGDSPDDGCVELPSREPCTSTVTYSSAGGQDFSRRLNQRFSKTRIRDEALHRGLLALIDQQLVTGLSILVVSYARHCSITQYYFAIIVDLAWISIIVMGAAITILAPYLRDPERRVACHFRVALIISMHIALIPTLLIAWNEEFLFIGGQSIDCILRARMLDVRPIGWVSIFLLIVNLIVIITSLYPRLFKGVRTRKIGRILRSPMTFLWAIVEGPGRISLWAEQNVTTTRTKLRLKTSTAHSRRARISGRFRLQLMLWRMLRLSFLSLFAILFSIEELAMSQMIQHGRLVASMLLAVMNLFLRRQNGAIYGLMGNPDQLGFGQLVALALLLLPLWTLVESLVEGRTVKMGLSDATISESTTEDSETDRLVGTTSITNKDSLTALPITSIAQAKCHDKGGAHDEINEVHQPAASRSSGEGRSRSNASYDPPESRTIRLQDRLYKSKSFRAWSLVFDCILMAILGAQFVGLASFN